VILNARFWINCLTSLRHLPSRELRQWTAGTAGQDGQGLKIAPVPSRLLVNGIPPPQMINSEPVHTLA